MKHISLHFETKGSLCHERKFVKKAYEIQNEKNLLDEDSVHKNLRINKSFPH